MNNEVERNNKLKPNSDRNFTFQFPFSFENQTYFVCEHSHNPSALTPLCKEFFRQRFVPVKKFIWQKTKVHSIFSFLIDHRFKQKGSGKGVWHWIEFLRNLSKKMPINPNWCNTLIFCPKSIDPLGFEIRVSPWIFNLS